jgi:type IV pilus assembly protein PilN
MKYTLNLATRSYVNRRTLYLCYALSGALLVIVLMFNLLQFLSLRSEISQNDANKKMIEAKLLARSGIDAAGYNANSYKALLVNIRYANEILAKDSFRWTRLLDQLESVVPRQVRILKIDPNHEKRTVKLAGHAKTLKAMKRFIDNLIKSEHYTHVFLDQQATVSEPKVIRFSITMEGAF